MSGIHPLAVVDASARIGDGVTIGPFAVIGPDVTIGDRTEIGPHVQIHGPTVIGRVHQAGSAISGTTAHRWARSASQAWANDAD